MTEDEAKTKWCPLSGDDNRLERSGRCIASDCMAWRWEYDGDGQRCGWGYCGLAGKP